MANPDNESAGGPTRRRVLRTAVGTAVGFAGAAASAGCRPDADDPGPIPPPDPAQPVLDGALSLSVGYERLIAARPALAARLSPIAAAHQAHAAELARVIGGAAAKTPAAAASGNPETRDVAGLRTAELRAQRTAATLCRTAPATRAALLGSIAAARAAHAEALRGLG